METKSLTRTIPKPISKPSLASTFCRWLAATTHQEAYHDFIGFQVSKDLLDRTFQKTYGLTLKDLFRTLDLALGTYKKSRLLSG